MTGRIGGRASGRTGPRIGLPLDHARPGFGSTPEAGRGGGWRPDPVLDPEPRREPAQPGGRTRAEALSIARLFEHMEPQPDLRETAFRRDAYEEAQTISHRAAPPPRLSPATKGALAAGATVSLAIVFVAGFLSAVLMLGERDPDGEIAIRTAPGAPQAGLASADGADNPPGAAQILPSTPAETAVPPQRELLPSANAERSADPPPAPEIAAAEQARDSAIAPPAGESNVAPPPGESNVAPPAAAPALPDARVATDRRVYPPAKPDAPDRAQSASVEADEGPAGTQAGLPPPGGNYSLQFGAFRDRANAEALLRELQGIAQAGIAEEAGATGRTLFFVRAGAFRTRADALQAVESLRRESGHVTFVHANAGTG